MGYESKLFFCQDSDMSFEDTKNKEATYASIICVFDLSKVGGDLETLAKKSKRAAYVYGIDGNAKFTEDAYGNMLTKIEPKEVLKVLKKIHKGTISQYDNGGKGYRRTRICINLLKDLIEEFPNLTVIHFGH